MTKDQATAVVAVVRSGGVPQEFAPSTIELWEDALLPLPFDYCLRAARRWMLSTPTDEHGQPVPKFVSEPGAVLTGCGVPFGARHLVDRALRDGGEVYPSLRGALADGGWEYVPPGAVLPRGVGEWYVNAGLPIPADRTVDPTLEPTPERPALGPGGAVSAEQVRANVAKVGGLVRTLSARRRLAADVKAAASDAVIEAELAAFDARYKALERGGP